MIGQIKRYTELTRSLREAGLEGVSETLNILFMILVLLILLGFVIIIFSVGRKIKLPFISKTEFEKKVGFSKKDFYDDGWDAQPKKKKKAKGYQSCNTWEIIYEVEPPKRKKPVDKVDEIWNLKLQLAGLRAELYSIPKNCPSYTKAGQRYKELKKKIEEKEKELRRKIREWRENVLKQAGLYQKGISPVLLITLFVILFIGLILIAKR